MLEEQPNERIFPNRTTRPVQVQIGRNLRLGRNFMEQSASSHYVQVVQDEHGKTPDIHTVHRFCELLSATERQHPDKTIVVCSEKCDPSTTMSTFFLVGAYLVLRKGKQPAEVMETAKDIGHLIAPGSSHADMKDIASVKEGLDALYHARKLSWLGPNDADQLFDLEMIAHYSATINGGVYTLVPGKLLLFPTPEPLPDGQLWIDAAAAPGRTADRRFSAAYLADVLADLGASAVVCLGECPPGAAEALEERGLDVHALRLDPRRPALLRAMDRLLALARAAPGAVALCGGGAGGGGAGAEWAGVAWALGAAYLMRDFGFDAPAADAWLRLAGPALRPAPAPAGTAL